MPARSLALALAISGVVAAAPAQQPPRDVRRADSVGTSSIAGRVMSDEPQPKPLRRARVTLNGSELGMGRTTITADNGTFLFDRLPAGGYIVRAAKDSYVTLAYGARRPSGQGTTIQVGDGQRRNVTVRIPKGAVITGTVVDPEGQPMPGVMVSAMAYRFAPNTAERRLVSVGGFVLPPTDDRGMYRIFGLPAGDYVVSAVVRQFAGGGPELRVLTTGEIQQALADVGRGLTRNDDNHGLTRNDDHGMTRNNTEMGSRTDLGAATDARRGVAFAPVYYPGTAVSAQASTVTVAYGEERAGIDIPFQYAPTATVEGSLISSTGQAQGTAVMLMASDPNLVVESVRVTTAGPDGRFSFSGIPPGQYTAIVRPTPIGGFAGARRPEAPAPAGASMVWALTSITVQGEDVSGVALMLQPGLTISGRVVFEGAKPPAADLPLRYLPLPVQVATSNMPIPMPALRLDAGGRFTIADIIPGPYRLSPTAQGIRSPIGTWWLKSIVITGRDFLDSPLELRQSTDDAIVTFSDRATELVGVASDARGNPAFNAFVVVFAADNSFWFPGSRRIAGVRSDASGKFTIRNLPPGDYLAVAAMELDDGEWFDSRVLQRLAASAVTLSLGEGEKKVQDLRVQ